MVHPHPGPPAGAGEVESLERGPREASHRLVLLHGWGADADDLLDLAEAVAHTTVNVVALRAPEPHPGGSGRQWYPLQPIDWDQLPAAREHLRSRLEALGQTIPLECTVVLGFSQGGAMALDVGSSLPMAGIVACSGYPHAGWVVPANPPPVLLTHGTDDPVVPFAASQELVRLLREAGGRADLLPFAGGHGIDPALLPAVAGFIRERLQPTAGGS